MRESYLKKVSLFDEYTCEKFYDKLTLYYIETKKFKKSEEELSSQLDYLLYVLNNLVKLQEIPEKLEKDGVMQKFFDVAEFLKLSKDEQFAYQQDLKSRLDYINVLRYAKESAEREGFSKGKEEGLKEGIEKGIEKKAQIEIAKNLLNSGVNIELIIQSTGLSRKKIEELKKSI
jgi:predicted transposase/invertase (TIGR01784 family)